MDPNTYRVFDYVLENPKPDLHLNVTSNFSVEQTIFDKYIDYVQQLTGRPGVVEHFMQFVSLDTVGSQAEYIRHGLNYELCKSRIEHFIQQVPERSSLTFIMTMSNFANFVRVF